MEQQEQTVNETELELSEQTMKRRRTALDWAETVMTAVILVAVVFTFFFRVITVDGASMQPNYYDGDRVLVTSLGSPAEQGDVVIIVNALDEPIIKRVIATEGQVVDFDPVQNEVTVDGETVLGARFGIENGITSAIEHSAGTLTFPQTVPEGCVFVLGDNRQNSTDSRFESVGMVDRRNILGKVIWNLYPFSKPGT